MTASKVLAIVLNWRQPASTVECVQALQAMTYPSLSILVIDNGSGDESVPMLKRDLADVAILSLRENMGFAAGSNVGLRYALENEFEYALLMNNDAFPAAEMLERMLEEARPEIGLLSPKIYFDADPTRIWFANGRQHPTTLDLRDTGRGQMDSAVWDESRDVDYLLGTCLLVSLKGVDRVGLLDENYFMYFEDLDWSIRWREAGYRLRLVASAHLYHRIAASTGGIDTPLRRYHLARSSVIFWRKHAKHGKPLIILLFRLGSVVKMFVRLLVSGSISVLTGYLRGLCDGCRAGVESRDGGDLRH